jgi:hypothetical protein
VQVWVVVDDPAKLSQSVLTTWKITENPSSGWEAWQSFPATGQGPHDFMNVKAVGQLSDGRMQLFAISTGDTEDLGNLWWNWKTTTETNSSWTGWSRFDPAPVAATDFVAVFSLANGKLRIWTGGGTRPASNEVMNAPVQSAEQTSTNPAQAWGSWQAPFLPELTQPSLAVGGAAILLTSGSTQLWVVTGDGTLHSAWTSTANPPNWEPWVTPFLPNPGLLLDVAAARLKDGAVQLFVMTRPGAGGSVQILTSRQTSTQPNGNPSGWAPWTSLGTV